MERSKEANKGVDEFASYRVESCLGSRGCSNRVVCGAGPAESIRTSLRTRDFKAFSQKIVPGALKRHHEFRVSISDCPNACSRPQIVDIGLIGACRPLVTKQACSQCGACEKTCREGAITRPESVPQVDVAQCLNCGKCAEVCPTGTLQAGKRGYRILLGGKLGRHPSLATELPGIYTEEEVAEILARCLDCYMAYCREGERLGELLAREGKALLREITA